jgi:hypothetical protein
MINESEGLLKTAVTAEVKVFQHSPEGSQGKYKEHQDSQSQG